MHRMEPLVTHSSSIFCDSHLKFVVKGAVHEQYSLAVTVDAISVQGPVNTHTPPQSPGTNNSVA